MSNEEAAAPCSNPGRHGQQNETLARRAAVLVSSCDRFSDLWAPFFCLVRKFWPDCPFRLFLITNHLRLDNGCAQSLALGEDRGWGTNLLDALGQIDADYIIYFQEDQYLLGPVDTARLLEDLALLAEGGVDALSFRAIKPKGVETSEVRDGVFQWPLDSRGGVYCDPAIWRKSSLASIIQRGETAWDFLEKGRDRAAERRLVRQEYHLSQLPQCPIHYVKRSAVRFGLWKPDGLAWLIRNRVPVLPLRRGLFFQSTKLYRLQRKPGASWWIRARFRGFGLLSILTQMQQRLTDRIVARHLARLGQGGVVPANRIADEYEARLGDSRPKTRRAIR